MTMPAKRAGASATASDAGWRARVVSAAAAAAAVPAGSTVYVGSACATPRTVVRALEDRPLTVNVAVGSVAEVLNLVAPRLTDLVHYRLGRRFPDSPAAARHRETETDRADAG